MFRDVTTRAGGRLDPVAVARKIARYDMAPRTAARYATALLHTFEDVPAWDAGGQRVIAQILDTATARGWRRYAVDPDTIREMSKAELIAWSVREQPSEMELRTAFSLWYRGDPTGPFFEQEYQAFASEVRRQGWGLSAKAIKASAQGAGKEEQQPMVNMVSEQVAKLAKAYATEHAVTFDVAMERVLEGDPNLKASYLNVPPAPKPAPLVAPALRSVAAEEVSEKARQYAAAHDLTVNEATAKVLADDADLRRRYLEPPTASKRYGLIAETEYETLVAGLTREQLMELMIERRLAEPGVPAQAADTLGQLALYEWIIGPGGQEHGSPAAAQMRDAMWAEVVRRRFVKYGFQQPPGR